METVLYLIVGLVLFVACPILIGRLIAAADEAIEEGFRP